MKSNNCVKLNSSSYINIYDSVFVHNTNIYYHTKHSIYRLGCSDELLYTNIDEEIIGMYLVEDKIEYISFNKSTSCFSIMSIINNKTIKKQTISLKEYNLGFVYNCIFKQNYVLLNIEANNIDKVIILDTNLGNFKILNHNNSGMDFDITSDILILNKFFNHDESRKDSTEKSYVVGIPLEIIFKTKETEIDSTSLYINENLHFKLVCQDVNVSYELLSILNEKIYISEYNYNNGCKKRQVLCYHMKNNALKIIVPYNLNMQGIIISNNDIIFHNKANKIYNSNLECIYTVKEENEIEKYWIINEQSFYLQVKADTITEIYYIEINKNIQYKVLELNNNYIDNNDIYLNIIISENNNYLLMQNSADNSTVEVQFLIKNNPISI